MGGRERKDAPSARRVQPPRLTLAGRSRGAAAAAGTLGSGAICSHPLESQTPGAACAPVLSGPGRSRSGTRVGTSERGRPPDWPA